MLTLTKKIDQSNCAVALVHHVYHNQGRVLLLKADFTIKSWLTDLEVCIKRYRANRFLTETGITNVVYFTDTEAKTMKLLFDLHDLMKSSAIENIFCQLMKKCSKNQ